MNESIIQQNKIFWDQEALAKRPWSMPVSSKVIAAAKEGDWNIHVTKKPIPRNWLPIRYQGERYSMPGLSWRAASTSACCRLCGKYNKFMIYLNEAAGAGRICCKSRWSNP